MRESLVACDAQPGDGSREAGHHAACRHADPLHVPVQGRRVRLRGHRASRITAIFLAGACPLNDDGSTAAVGDYAGQAVKAFENLRTALADAGGSVEDVLCTRVLVAYQGGGRTW